MRYLSLFSGIEAATVAWQSIGWKAVAYSEIEPFPCEVLRHYYSKTPNLGDVTGITEKQIKALGKIDLVVFGSPCQDLSVAGNRAGFNGQRSSLFRNAVRIIRWARKNSGCRFALWENVPGALTSNEGRDFTEVLQSLAGAKLQQPGKWRNAGIAVGKDGLVEWRTLDAQFFGVPQRRRRIFALADFGDYASREPILFESKSVQRNSQEIAEAEQEIAGAATFSVKCGSLSAVRVKHHAFDQAAVNSVAIAIHDKATRHRGGGATRNCDGSGNGLGIAEDGPMYTLTAGDKHAVYTTACFQQNQRNGDGLATGALSFQAEIKQQNYIYHPDQIVRRLTPIECERLQGFPDNYTQIPWRNKEAESCPDGPRYTSLGNSMPVPVMNWIGKRIQQAINEN